MYDFYCIPDEQSLHVVAGPGPSQQNPCPTLLQATHLPAFVIKIYFQS